MAVRERILAMGIPGTGKTYQWLKIAENLLPTGAKFRVLDTDDAIPYMLQTQFPHLDPKNKGNVYVHPAFDWPDYKAGLEWLLKEDKEGDWIVIDMADMAWQTVQRYFVGEVFDQSMGDYFLATRKLLREKGDKTSSGKPAKSIIPEAMRGWIDWPVINRLYDDWILPIVYRTKSHVYVSTKVQPVSTDDDPDTRLIFGSMGVRPSGQKNLGHQVHTCFLMTLEVNPANKTISWLITTAKDRANRSYFKRVKLITLYHQYFVAKAGWEVL